MTLKEAAVTVAIAILFTTFVLVTIDAFYPRPEYEDYCEFKPSRVPLNKESVDCDFQTTGLEDQCYQEEGTPRFDYDDQGCRVFKECDYCSKEYDNAQEKYSNNLFIILAPLGALAILWGVYYRPEFLGSGFMFSGIILMFYGTVQNFEDLNKYFKSFVILMELLLVLFIAYKKIIPDNKKK